MIKQYKLTTIKKWGGPWSRMHLELRRGTSTEASNYCKKDGNFIEIGEMKTNEAGKRNDLEGVKKAIKDGLSYDEICETYFATAAQYSKFIREMIQARDGLTAQASLKKEYAECLLRPWQKVIERIIKAKPDSRKIHWVWDPKGKTGKSWMASWLGVIHGALVLESSKKADLAYIFSKKSSKIVAIDLTRTLEGQMDHLYSFGESLKNGRIVSPKYESTVIHFECPHLIFFANFLPDLTKWSEDRYDVMEIDLQGSLK